MYLILSAIVALRLMSKAVPNALDLLGKMAYVLFAIISQIPLIVAHASILPLYPQQGLA